MSKLFRFCFTLTALSTRMLFASDPGEFQESRDLPELSYRAKNETPKKRFYEKKQDCPHPEESPPACEPVALLPSQPCPDPWRFSGAFLYLMPTLDDTYFVLDSVSDFAILNGKRKNNDFGFNPAFRVGAEYAFCDTHRELQAFYSHLTARQERTVVGSHLGATVGHPGTIASFEDYSGNASSTLSLLYQRLDVIFSQQAVNSHEMYFYIQPGIEYAYLRLNENYTYQITGGTLAVVNQKSRAWGVGPQIGLGLDYDFYQGSLTSSATQAFSVTALFSGSLLMGREKTENFQRLAAADQVNIIDEHTGRILPALHARAGLNYLVRGSKVGGSLGIGYEFNTYLGAFTRVIFPDDAANSLCTTNYYNFDIQGLYVSAALSF